MYVKHLRQAPIHSKPSRNVNYCVCHYLLDDDDDINILHDL